MKVVLSRSYGKNETKGVLYVFDGASCPYHCVSLELPDNGNQKNASCITAGVYDVEKYDSPSKGRCFHVTNVPGRDSILIHTGNYTHDTLGCILPGTYFSDIDNNGFIDVAESSRAMSRLLILLPDIFKLHII